MLYKAWRLGLLTAGIWGLKSGFLEGIGRRMKGTDRETLLFTISLAGYKIDIECSIIQDAV